MKQVIGHVQKNWPESSLHHIISVVFEQCYSGASMTTFFIQKANARLEVSNRKYQFFKFDNQNLLIMISIPYHYDNRLKIDSQFT